MKVVGMKSRIEGDGLSMGDELEAALWLLGKEEGWSKGSGGAGVRRACPC